MVRIMGKDGIKWEEFDPAEFQGDYEPRVQLDISIQNKKHQQASQAKDMLAAFMNSPVINQEELSKLVLQRAFDLDPDEVEVLIQAPPMQPPMGAPDMGMPPDAGMGAPMPLAPPPMVGAPA